MANKKLKTISVGTIPMLAYANSVEEILFQYAKQCFRDRRAPKKKRKEKYEDKRNWKTYNTQLIKRGEFYINPVFLETWLEETKEMNLNKVGQPYLYPPSLIRFLAILHSKGFDYRALEGVMKALSKRLGGFPVISFSQIRRRILELPLQFKAKSNELTVGIDGTGVKVSNRGEWMRQKVKKKLKEDMS